VAPVDWLGDPHRALPAIILMAVWKNFSYDFRKTSSLLSLLRTDEVASLPRSDLAFFAEALIQ
jgi:ABC-type sugar transport system permease subunit